MNKCTIAGIDIYFTKIQIYGGSFSTSIPKNLQNKYNIEKGLSIAIADFNGIIVILPELTEKKIKELYSDALNKSFADHIEYVKKKLSLITESK